MLLLLSVTALVVTSCRHTGLRGVADAGYIMTVEARSLSKEHAHAANGLHAADSLSRGPLLSDHVARSQVRATRGAQNSRGAL
jgi:hypothetical protein